MFEMRAGVMYGSALKVMGTAGLLSPRVLFKNGAKGWLFICHPMYLFQDMAGTIPAVVGGTVALWLDVSGNGNHLVQSSPSSQPKLQIDSNGAYYLACDGIDDFMVTLVSVDMTHTAEISTFMKLRMLDNSRLGYPFTFGDYSSSVGVLHIRAPQATGTLKIGCVSKGVSLASTDVSVLSLSTDAVISALSSTNNLLNLNINGINAQSAGNQGGGKYGSHLLCVGRRSGLYDPFAGRIYGFGGLDRLLTDAERTRTEKWLSKMGVLL